MYLHTHHNRSGLVIKSFGSLVVHTQSMEVPGCLHGWRGQLAAGLEGGGEFPTVGTSAKFKLTSCLLVTGHRVTVFITDNYIHSEY